MSNNPARCWRKLNLQPDVYSVSNKFGVSDGDARAVDRDRVYPKWRKIVPHQISKKGLGRARHWRGQGIWAWFLCLNLRTVLLARGPPGLDQTRNPALLGPPCSVPVLCVYV